MIRTLEAGLKLRPREGAVPADLGMFVVIRSSLGVVHAAAALVYANTLPIQLVYHRRS